MASQRTGSDLVRSVQDRPNSKSGRRRRGANGRLERPPRPVACGVCHGPFFLCQGHHDPEESGISVEELRAVTGLRAAYLGLLLMPIAPTELLGGALLQAAQGLLFGARCTSLAAIVADPQIPGADPIDLAKLAAESIAPKRLDRGEVVVVPGFHDASANRLWKALRAERPRAHYLLDAVKLAMRAALASPVTELDGFDLVGVLCEACASRVGSAPDDRLCAVEVYDHAVRCPVCGVEHAHPLGRQRRIHPVARCFGEDGKPCEAHRGVLAGCLCDEGRSLYEAAFANVGAANDRRKDCCKDERDPSERRLLDALLRAKKREDLDALERPTRTSERSSDRAIDPADALWKKLGRVIVNVLEKALEPGKKTAPGRLSRAPKA